MTEQALPPGDEHEIIRHHGDLAVVVPLGEYRKLKFTYDWHNSSGRVSTNPEEFLLVSGLTAEEQQVLRERYGLPGSA
ncbi:hypothetical protein ACIBHX_46985 [Nonomuraea sp. NPDC050536]|uniref:hypothetical protein n=1 Tax=Nonomuraea sp. NPDC050536 TaxID=3364366 RepID=UPI0037C8E47B